MKSSAVLNSRQERTAGSTSHFGSSKDVSGSSAIMVGGFGRERGALLRRVLRGHETFNTYLAGRSQVAVFQCVFCWPPSRSRAIRVLLRRALAAEKSVTNPQIPNSSRNARR